MMISELRVAARQIWEAALEAASPEVCLRRAVKVTQDGFSVGGETIERLGRLIVVGAGKASARMAQVTEELFRNRITRGLVITKYGHMLSTEAIQVIEAGHPVPDEAGELAVEKMKGLLLNLDSNDVVLCLFSGGGSALLPAPAEGIQLQEKQQVTSALLRAGAPIEELNAVRKHLSAIKGGQLARWAAPARVVSLTMSDVIGDSVEVICSGPTAPDSTSFADAISVIRKYALEVPQAVEDRFERGVRGKIAETPKQGEAIFKRVSNHVIANNHLLLRAASIKAQELGFSTLVLSSQIDGEARDVGQLFAAIGREIALTGQPIPAPACILGAGETTVTVTGSGLGGRNQEMALAWALKMQSWEEPICFASFATDGTDGPTMGAGGLVDPETCTRARELNLDPRASLQSNDSFNLLQAVDDLIATGPTQTNLSDLQILLAG